VERHRLRRDPFARDRRFRASQAKTGRERGRYLHPELYGKPRSASVIRPPTTRSQAQGRADRPKLASER